MLETVHPSAPRDYGELFRADLDATQKEGEIRRARRRRRRLSNGNRGGRGHEQGGADRMKQAHNGNEASLRY